MKVTSSFLLGFLLAPTSAIKADATPPALRVRGGATITPKALAKVYAGFYGLNGITAMPAPESAGDFGTELQECTTDYVIFENMGATSLGYAIMVYLATTQEKTLATAKIVAYSGLPCTYVTYKNMLKGVSSKLSGARLPGLIQTIFMVACVYAIFAGKGDTQLIAEIFAVLPLLLGIVSVLNPEKGMQLAGVGTATTKFGKAAFIWWTALLVGWGTMSLLLLSGRDAMESVGIIAVLETLFMIDCIWIRKWNEGVAPSASNYVFLGIPLLTAIGMILIK